MGNLIIERTGKTRANVILLVRIRMGDLNLKKVTEKKSGGGGGNGG